MVSRCQVSRFQSHRRNAVFPWIVLHIAFKCILLLSDVLIYCSWLRFICSTTGNDHAPTAIRRADFLHLGPSGHLTIMTMYQCTQGRSWAECGSVGRFLLNKFPFDILKNIGLICEVALILWRWVIEWVSFTASNQHWDGRFYRRILRWDWTTWTRLFISSSDEKLFVPASVGESSWRLTSPMIDIKRKYICLQNRVT